MFTCYVCGEESDSQYEDCEDCQVESQAYDAVAAEMGLMSEG